MTGRVAGEIAVRPPAQRPYDQALQLGFATLLARGPDAAALLALGACAEPGAISLPVLNRTFRVNLARREVQVASAGRARPAWAVLVVHYLCADAVAPDGREVSFGYFSDCRSYLSVFGQRIVGRFLATTGRTAAQFAQRSDQLGGTRRPAPGLRYRFDLLPRVPLDLVRYEGDAEMDPGASVLYRADAERLLPAEDRVVAAELLLDTLAGKPMTENGGPDEGR